MQKKNAFPGSKNTFMKITVQELRKLIREEIGRSFKTLNDDPFSYSDYKEVDIDIYPVERGDSYEVKIETQDGTISLPTRVFPSEQEATHYARSKSEEIRRILGARQK
jgi:hypothetical protein